MVSSSKRMLLMVVLSVVGIIGGLSSKTYAAGDASFTRISGQDRYETSIEISKNGWQRSDAVILACGEDFPDGLTGVTLAYIKDAPILLTPKDQLPQSTLLEIQRLSAKNIYILGGTGVISANIDQQLSLLNYKIERISGLNRFQTAIEVGKSIKNNSTDTAVIATAYDFPDALSIGPAAGRNNMPILFTDKSNLTLDTKQALINWNIKKVVIAGGTGVVSNQVELQIKALGISVERLSGVDRYTTALSIARRYNINNSNNIILAKGEDFPDALAGGSLAAKNNLPILLTSKETVPDKIIGYIDEVKARDIYLLGGISAISDNVKDSIKIGTLGSIQGNISNSGYAVKQGDWIYYCHYGATNIEYPMAPNGSAIYKMKSDGSNKTKLITVSAFDLNIKGDWLYYIDYSSHKICKIKTDASNNQQVSNMTVHNNMIIVGDWIYVNDSSSNIILIKLDNSQYDNWWGGGRDLVVSGYNVYFNYMGDNDSIWRTNSSNNSGGKDKGKVNDEPSYNINLYRDTIFYTDSQHNICSISSDGGAKTIIGNDRATSLTSLIVDEGWIYYSSKNDDDKLYKMRIDGTSITKVSDISIPVFNIVGDWVIYHANAQTNFIKK